jgi:hypothetical protein
MSVDPMDKVDLVDFGEAIKALKEGKRIARYQWKHLMFIFQQVPANIDMEIVPNMQSLPETVKEAFLENGHDIQYSNQIAMSYMVPGTSPDIQNWTARTADILAEDWVILD